MNWFFIKMRYEFLYKRCRQPILTIAMLSILFLINVSEVFAQSKTKQVDKRSIRNVKQLIDLTIPKWIPADNVIQRDIRYAVALGVYHLQQYFNADLHDAPSFHARYLDNGDGEFDVPNPSGISHVIGRGLLGLLLAEEVVGIPVPDSTLQIFERFLKDAYSYEGSLNAFIDTARNSRPYMAAHNMREGLYGLIYLGKRRSREWALEKAGLMIAKLEKITDSNGHFSVALAKEAGLDNRFEGIGGDDATTSGRIIEPLLEYYIMTKSSSALRLAGLYASSTLGSAFTQNGDIKPFAQSGGHIHSLTSSLCGIIKYAVLSDDKEMLRACIQIMDNGIRKHSSSWGWVDEVTVDHWANEKLRGEMNQTGDVIRAALLLGNAGYIRFYDIAERFLRNMLLQGQHFEKEMKRYVRDNPSPLNDRERRVMTRNIGGYSMQLPNDRMQDGKWPLSTLDVTSGAIHALCEAWRNRAVNVDSVVRLNLLFDFQNEDIEISSSLPLVGKIQFFKKTEKDLYVRIPNWVNETSLSLEVMGKQTDALKMVDGYLHVGKLYKGAAGTISFTIKSVRKAEEIEGVKFSTTWWGDQVIDIDPPGKISPIPFDNR